MGFIENANSAVARSFVGKYFRLDGSGHVRHPSLRRFDTFTDTCCSPRNARMLASSLRFGLVSPPSSPWRTSSRSTVWIHLIFEKQCSLSSATILADTGGTCVCPPADFELDQCLSNQDYMLCKAVVKRDLVTATAAISALTSFCMGLFANMPIALAPGMGLNAYFAYTVVGFHGGGKSRYTDRLVRFCITFCDTCHFLPALAALHESFHLKR